MAKTNSPLVKKIAKAAFPEYTGRKFFVEGRGSVTFWNTNWCEGTCNEYVALNLVNGKAQAFKAPAPWFNPVEGETVNIPAGCAIVERAYYRGVPVGLTVFLGVGTGTAALPAPSLPSLPPATLEG